MYFIIVIIFINRENEVLKVQLKKYVGAVQMLRREGQTVEGKDKMKEKIILAQGLFFYMLLLRTCLFEA